MSAGGLGSEAVVAVDGSVSTSDRGWNVRNLGL